MHRLLPEKRASQPRTLSRGAAALKVQTRDSSASLLDSSCSLTSSLRQPLTSDRTLRTSENQKQQWATFSELSRAFIWDAQFLKVRRAFVRPSKLELSRERNAAL
ncbi:unnamed protein product [Ixodes hexagonus]